MKSQVYQIITDQIISKLEAGIIPWQRPWCGGQPATNLVSKKPYRGINVFILACSGFTSPYWLTFRQAKALGGHVRKGEKSTIITFWSLKEKVDPKDSGDAEGPPKRFAFLRYYRVFNVEQCELDPKKIPVVPVHEFQPIEEAERIVADMPNRPEISFRGPEACYSPARDCVNMPRSETFVSDYEYYSTLFHELTHSTGHRSRLNRKSLTKKSAFGSELYSQEELVAEMGSSYLCGACGISTQVINNQAAYIQGWLKRFNSDPKMLISAASQAQKAADYIQGL